MKIATLVIQNAVRLLGVVMIVLGLLFWSGRSFELVPVHMRLGEILVGLLWILAAMACARASKRDWFWARCSTA